ncbi:uncharacterized protein LOC110459729 isoform X4 [Mizuhopecten yessoensis]|uniref:uncharacterized protein LOC110459729 isoform X4 n=1 Tax=Mizuhopecten yessoensis TaxID=6573 RepID=UPI000B45B531|nr:uncharacterized protein LOC110459729 isoform X4 [Mizuhopecten yessoensis]
MARHRNVRTMNYEDECYDEDDYLGHSVEDNYCISPGTAAQFTFNREKDFDLSTYMSNEKIPEEEEGFDSDTDPQSLNDSQGYKKPTLSDTDQGKLNSCLEEIRNIIGDNTPDHVLCQTIIRNKYDLQASLNELLTTDATPKPQRQPRQSRRNRPQGDDNVDDDLNMFIESLESESLEKTHFLSDQNRHVGILKFGKQSPVVDSPIHNNVRQNKTDITSSESADSFISSIVSNTALGESDSSLKGTLQPAQPKDKVSLHGQTKSAGFSLSNLAKQHSVGATGQEVRLASLAKPCVKGQQVMKNKDLSSLGKLSPQTTGVTPPLEGATASEQQNARQPLTSSQFTGGSQSGSNKPAGLSLTDLIKQSGTDNKAGLGAKDASLIHGHASRVSLVDLAGQRSQSDVGEVSLGSTNTKVSLSDLATSSKSSGPLKPVQKPGQSSSKIGKSLADLASQHKAATGGADMNPLKPNSVAKKSVVCQLSGLSLADMAKSQKSQPLKGQTTSCKSLRDLAPKLNRVAKTPSFSDVSNQSRSKNVEQCVEESSMLLSGKAEPVSLVQEKNTRNDEQALSDKFSELMTTKIDYFLEDETDLTDRVRMVSPSILAKTLSSSFVRSKQLDAKKRLRFRKFSYRVQMCKVKENLAMVKKNIVSFDFSTPSPDDIIKEKQNLAFTRSGR